MNGASATQLDLFLDSRAVALANEILAAVLMRDDRAALVGLRQARLEGHDHPALPALERLTRALVDWRPPARNAHAIAKVVAGLDQNVVPAAQSALGDRAQGFVAGFFDQLSELARDLPYDPAHRGAHRASLRLRCADFIGAEQAAQSIPGWTTMPDALHWITIARYRLHGLEAARSTLFAFAWVEPGGVERLLRELNDEVLDRDWRAFEAACDWDSIPAGTLPAWFPAWYVMEHPAVAASLDPASFPDMPAAAAARLM